MSMWRLALSVVAGVVHGFSMAWPASMLGTALGIAGLSSGLLQCVSLGVLAALFCNWQRTKLMQATIF